MILICLIDILVASALVYLATSEGLEAALPFAAFCCVLVPGTASFSFSGLFELTTQRLVVVVLLLLYLALKRPDSDASPVKRNPLVWLMAVQVLWCLVSTADSIVPVLSIKKLLAEVAEYYLLYHIYVKIVTSIRTVHRILFAMVGAIFVCSIFGAVEAYTGWSVLTLFPTHQSLIEQMLGVTFGPDGRVASTFPHPILFGAALVMAIVLALYLVSVEESPGRKYFLWAALLLMFLNIYKTESRGPWLGLILAFAVFLLFGTNKIRKYQMAIAVLSLAVLIVRPGVWDTIRNLYSETFDYGSFDTSAVKGLSFDYRLVLRQVAQKALDKNFTRELWGYGMESFTYLNLKGNLAGHEYPFLSCDSAWVELMVETGYVGLFLIALLLFKPAWLAWQDYRRIRGPDRYLVSMLLICMISYYFMMMSVAMYAWGQEGYMLWILIALSIVCGKLGDAKAKVEQPQLRELAAFRVLAPAINRRWVRGSS